MKRILFSAAVLLAALQLYAAPVGRSRALSSAKAFLARQGVTMAAKASLASRAPRRAGAQVDSSYYYVFNAGGNQGYVVVAGDDRVPSILGYVGQGSFDEHAIPDNMRAWLQSYADDIKLLDSPRYRQAAASRPSRVAGTAQVAKHAVAPLLNIMWNQGDPYNLKCPIYNNDDGTPSGQRSATGCVATSLAQVIGYYKYPGELQADIPYYTFKSGGKTIIMRTIRKGAKIDWANMLDTYTDRATEAQKNAVADLMLYVGQMVKMSYGPSSGSSFSAAPPVLKKAFGFDDGLYRAIRNDYTISEWNDLIYNEIATGHPVPYGGSSTGGGHAFVLDGYDGNGLFHVNWGWGGGSNGYFRIAVLNPGDNSGIGASSSSDGYSMGQDAIIGLRLPDDVKAPETAQGDNHCLSINDTELKDGVVTSNFVNWSGATRSYELALGRIEADGTLTKIGAHIENGAAVANYNVSGSIGVNTFWHESFKVTGLAPGTYKVVPMCRLLSSNAPWMTSFDTRREYIVATVGSDGGVTLSFHHGDIVATGIRFVGNRAKDSKQNVDISFKSLGEEFFGEVHMFANLEGKADSLVCRSQVAVGAADSTVTTFFFTPRQEGTYKVKFAFDGGGRYVIADTTMTVGNGSDAPSLNFLGVAFDGKSGGNVYGTSVSGVVRLGNLTGRKDFDGVVNIQLFYNDNGWYGGENKAYTISIPYRKRDEIPFKFDNLVTNREYRIKVAVFDKELGSIFNDGRQVTLRPGIVAYMPDGTTQAVPYAASYTAPEDAVAVDARGVMSINTMVPSTNPNAVYVFDGGRTIPTSLQGANVVQAGKAAEIRLQDGYPYYSPVAYTASSIAYSRKMATAGNGEQWETMALPFEVQAVKAAGASIDWRHGNTAEGDFWLRQFTQVDADGRICFDAVEKADGLVPYLVSVPQSMEGQELVFSAVDAAVKASPDLKIVASTDGYTFVGTTLQASLEDVYALNADGTSFDPVAKATVEPFRAYFASPLKASARKAHIALDSVTNGIVGIHADGGKTGREAIYTLQGVRVEKAVKGVYIVNGRKMVVK